MIDITKLKKEDIGKWVEYIGTFAEYQEHLIEKGKIKSWNNKYIFVVYKCAGNWNRFQDYTGVATNPERLMFI